jgi:hypothetical protein
MMKSLRSLFKSSETIDRVEPTMSTRAPRRHLPTLYPLSSKLSVAVEGNPKRKGTQAYARFEKYFNCSNVDDAIEAGILYKDIDNDYMNRFIRIDGKTLSE